jgi:hypothetical protein
MSETLRQNCPECEDFAGSTEAVGRRAFMRQVGQGATALVAAGAFAGAAPSLVAAAQPPAATATARAARPAEDMIRELFTSLTADQRRVVVHPWDERRGNALGRQGMFNAAYGGQAGRIGQVYTPAQRDLCMRILRSISSDEEGFRRISRNGTWDNSGAFTNCGADIFGDPSNGQQFAWLFTGHHLTVRCDGNSEPGAAFGGPIYYGHSPDGYSQRNCFYYQTRSVLDVYDALNEQQRRQAVVVGTPGEQAPSVRFRPANQRMPGIPASELTRAQKQLIERVMRDVLQPFRREDADEVMEVVRRNGGLERIHLAFYRDRGADDNANWHFWRLEGPGFVWNYRVLPHVHTFVNISSAI